MKELQLNIISAERTIYKGVVKSITLPGELGGFSVFPDHAPLVSSLRGGAITYEADGKSNTVEIKGGFVEIKQDVVTVCVE